MNKKFEVGMYVEWQPHNGRQPRGASRNVRIVEVLPNNEYRTACDRTIKEIHILGQNLR